MKKIFKILSKSIPSILVVIVLLFIQAQCDLALPDYTAKIVNVGIQQSGIEESIPEKLTEETYQKLLMVVNNKDKINSYYKKIDTKKYSYQGNIYKLKKEPTKKIKKDITVSLIILDSMKQKNNKNVQNYDPKQMISKLNVAKTKLEKMEQSLLDQMAVSCIKKEYKKIGIDVKKKQTNYIVNSGIKMIILAFIIMFITIIVCYLSSIIAAKFSRDLRNKVVNKVMKFSNKEFEDIGTSSLITRSTNDIQQIQMLIVMFLRIVIFAPILGFGALSKVSGTAMSWVIGIAVLAIIGLLIVLFTIALPKFKIVQQMVDKLNLVSREILTGLPVIRAFSNEKHEEKRFDKANKDLTSLNLFVNRIMAIMMPTMMFIMNGISILIVWVGAGKIDAGTMQVGTLISFITYTMQIIMSFLMISMVSIILPRAWISIKRTGEILNKDISVKEIKNPEKFIKNQKGIVEFKDVYFRYPDAEEDVLRNISFKSLPGTTTAFIGSTGSGKSTLINLIPRFFDVTGGKILIDGKNIKKVSLKDLRKKIGFVPQKGILFSGTIKSNIKFGNDKLTNEQMKEVAKVAQAIDFIEEKEEKFNSEISQDGTNVSGGQRQRLAIARAVAINPEIYVFDDSFSALDYKTDIKLRKALNKYTKGSTIFIVAQRISTVLKADQIIVLDEGKIVGIGKHDDLMKNCEVYQQIAYSQLSKEELENGK